MNAVGADLDDLVPCQDLDGLIAKQLGEVQPQGKRLMGAVEWARGVRPEGKEIFE